MDRPTFLSKLARPGQSRIVLLVLDGVGDLRTAAQPQTALERARTPNLDELAAVSALGRLDPVAPGITPGSGPGHLGLFGYDPADPSNDIGRGVLEALGLGLEVGPQVVAARGNFASVDERGRLTDRRAGRIATSECERLCERISPELAARSTDDLAVRIVPGEGYRFVLLFEGPGLSAELADTDPQRLGVEPVALRPTPDAEDPQRAEETVLRLRPPLEAMAGAIADEERANSFLLRGFSRMPELPSFETLYRLKSGAFAGYPLYRGVASACGMEVVDCGKRFADILEQVTARWQDFDFFFLHVKQTDMAGEDGSLDAKVEVLEEVDERLPALLELGPDVLAITADHSTPAPMRAHSWHPVPLLVHAETAFVDDARRFDELAAIRGALGTLPSRDLMGILLAHAGRLAKYGA